MRFTRIILHRAGSCKVCHAAIKLSLWMAMTKLNRPGIVGE